MDELKLTIQEAQELLLLSQSSVYSWIDKGKLSSIETPGGKLIVISRKEAEEIKNFNLKSRRNKAAKQFQQKNSDDSTILEISATNAEILENDTGNDSSNASSDLTLQLISRIEELAMDAGRFKQLEILRNEEKENVKFWQEKYYELSADLKKKDAEILELRAQIASLSQKAGKSIFDIFKNR